MKDDSTIPVRRVERGFSLLEMVVVVSFALILIGLAAPRLMTMVYAVKIRYSASNLSGLLQQARMEAVRRNSFYSVQQTTTSNNVVDMFVDIGKNATLVNSDPQAIMANQVTVTAGPGSGAPGEAAFLASFTSFTFAPSGTAASFNARGLPCLATVSACPENPGVGFVYFVSGAAGSGRLGWAAVVVTPSGRAQVWSYDGTNWVQ